MMRGGLLIALVLSTPAFAVGLLETNHAAIEAGMDAWDDGRYEDALAAFQAAKPELPGDPRVDFNIGNALYKLGRYEEAKEAWVRAAENDKGKGALRQKDYYNLGNAFAQLNKKKDAVAAYRKALTLDPTDPMARHNLEVLLRNIPPQESPNAGDGGHPDAGSDGGTSADGGQDGGSDGGSDGGTDGGSSSDDGSDGGTDGGSSADGGSDGGTGDGGTGDGGTSDGGQSDGGSKDGGSGESEGGGDGGSDGGVDGGSPTGGEAEMGDGGTPANLSEQDAEKLLDSMKQNEKNLQLWRFQQQKSRKDHEKDW